jgi:hypothetical protein
MDYRLEQQIRLDLEMALAQVRATIKADCRMTEVNVRQDLFFVRLTVGEYQGLKDWQYPVQSEDADPFLPAGEVDLIDVFAFDMTVKTELEMYLQGDQILIGQSWTLIAEQIVNAFFEENPEYQQAIDA